MSTVSAWPFLRISHRGAAGLEPENTLRGIEAALRYGVEMVEIDVRPCNDGTLVVIHDDSLERTGGVPGKVSQMTVAELKAVDVGKGERIPTLDEALALIHGRALVNIDQKADNLAPQLLRAIDRAGCREETMLSGNASRTFQAMRELAPSIHVALSVDARYQDVPMMLLARYIAGFSRGQAGRLIGMARDARLEGIALDWRLASAPVVALCKRAGLHVLTWTVDDVAAMRKLRAAGVDGITSNRPDLLIQVR